MNNILNEELRLRFEAETDIQINEKLLNWKPYAIWLEKLKMQKLNNEIIAENNKFREAYWQTMELLEGVLVSPIES
ncbi:MAG: hypothetical protein WC860_01690 [Candidatus Margulisiibacteriota bacterium]|jgi:hypothetical protein